jgi:antitoxin (DNA-binding transcriptional repressor) of toxin-antitoxin stability system
MKQVNIHQAKTELSKLIERAEAGEEIVIAEKTPVHFPVPEPE